MASTELSGETRPSAIERTRWTFLPCGAPREFGLKSTLQRAVKCLLWVYMRLYHRYTFRYHPGMPVGRPYICAINHTSVLDVPALMVADPYDPPSSMVIKSETMNVPILRSILSTWGAVAVERNGQDLSAIRQIKKILAEGRGVCVAPSGTRSVDGRLGPISPVLVRLILQSNAAVFPVGIVGGRECLPKHGVFPRPGRISLVTGPEIDLQSFRGRRLSNADLEAAARLIRDAIAALLPPEMQPAPETPVLGNYRP